ncbi:MAG: hypothetical protein KBS52_03645 [Clostridiales bacterium]|nr:hypothetical protein [Candidatus Equinaster intestinalis]
MKKVISLLLVAGMLVCALCGCGENTKESPNTETESQMESDDRQTASIQSEAKSQSQVQTESVTPEPTYYHAAIKGAVIVNQDGSPSFKWSRKCEECGKVESNTNLHNATGGTYHGSFSCTACHETQQFEIKTTKND